MAPPISFFNTPWGRAHADFDDSAISPTSSYRARQPHTPPQAPSSPAPCPRGSLPSLSLYHTLSRTAQTRGFPPPSRASVEVYAARALPPTPTSSSVGSVEEITLSSPAASVFSAREVLDPWVCGVEVRLRRKEGWRDLGRRGSATLPGVGMLVQRGQGEVWSVATRSTVDSEVETLLLPPPSPRWVKRMRKRAHWTLRWFEQYREDQVRGEGV